MASQDADENLTVSTVFEILKSQNFLNDLYWDAVSSIKEKPTFTRVREVIEKVIKDKTLMIETKPDLSEKIKKEIVAQICSMTYAIDAVFSKILYMKLDKYFKETIRGVVEDLTEGKLSEKISSKIQFSSNVGECSSKTNDTKSIDQQKETEKEPQLEKRKQNDITCSNNKLGHPKNVAESKARYGTRKLSKKDIEDSIKASKTVTKKTGPSATSSPRKKPVDKDADIFSKNTVVRLKPEKEDEVSDAESDISVGHLSIASVSSVHTSDLSSFDDEISIGSGDEDGSKKRLSLKYLQELCENGLPKLEKITNGIKRKEPTDSTSPEKSTNATKRKQPTNGIKPKESEKEKKNKLIQENNSDNKKENQISPSKSTKTKEIKSSKKIQASAVKVTPNTPESTSSESSTMVSSKRIRKPNSKYSSDNVVCQSVKVKERKKQPDVPPKSTNGKDYSNENSLNERKRLKSESLEIGTPNKIQKLDSVEKEKNEKSTTTKNETSVLCKPQYPVRSLTSRKSAPLTLFSTS